MIVSHEHRFIFVKTKKTAGTSVEIALSRFAGPRDVITPLTEEDELLRKECGGVGPQNLDIPKPRWRRHELARFRAGKPVTYFNHMPAADIRRCEPRAWREYLTFAVERNPWDLAISGYYWVSRAGGDLEGISLDDFLASERLRGLSNWPRYTVDDRIIVDRVLRYESLEEELRSLCEELGVGAVELPRAKSSQRSDRRPAGELLSPAQQERVATVFAREIERFGFTV